MNEGQNKLNHQNNGGQIVHVEKSEMFSGPIPHPEIIERYEKIYQGAAKLIFEDWDRQVKHRHSLEKSVVYTDNIKSILGVVFGFILELGAIGGGIYSVIVTKLITFGLFTVIVGMGMLITTFITSRKKNKTEEKKEK